MKIARLAKKAATIFFTLGGSVTLGLLSFSGMYVLAPVLLLGAGAFILSTAYESEIYYVNIAKTLKKLFNQHYYKQKTSNALLAFIIKENKNSIADLPAFFKDHQDILNHLKRHPKDEKAKRQKKAMHRFFMQQFFYGKQNDLDYSQRLHTYLNTLSFQLENGKTVTTQKIKNRHQFKQKFIKTGLIFSFFAGAAFGYGTIYLLLDAFTKLSFLAIPVAAMPFIIVPLSVLAAGAYALLIYNSLSDMVQNSTLKKWYYQIKKELKEPGVRSILLAFTAVGLIILGTTLTIFTAGTWWTVAKNSSHLLPFMKKVPQKLVAILLAFFTGLAALIFDFENVKASWDTVRYLFKREEANTVPFKIKVTNFFKALVKLPTIPFHYAKRAIISHWQEEAWLEFINPFRFVIACIHGPIKFIAFIGHIISIGAQTDRLPGVPSWLSTLLSSTTEMFEDLHYFVQGKNVEQNDIPSKIIKTFLSPLFLLSTAWQWATSDKTFSQSWQTQWGSQKDDAPIPAIETTPLWQQQYCLMKLTKAAKRYEKAKLGSLKEQKHQAFLQLIETVETKGNLGKVPPVLQKQRHRFFNPPSPHSAQVIAKIKSCVAPCA